MSCKTLQDDVNRDLAGLVEWLFVPGIEKLLILVKFLCLLNYLKLMR